MALGTVKWFDDSRGFGMILTPDGSEIFVHYSSIDAAGRRTLAQGQRVKFDVYEDKKGRLARNVHVML